MKTTIEIRNKIILENQWVIGKNIAKYKATKGFNWEDARSNALIYMIRGIETYDETEKTKISTHLFNWAKAGVLAYMYENRIVHVPWNRINKQNKLNKDGKESDEVLIPGETYIDQQTFFNSGEPINSGSNDSIQNQMLRALTSEPDNVCYADDLRDHVEKVIDQPNFLSDIERFTVVHRFGLKGNERKTQKEIASLSAGILGRKYTTMGINKAEKRAKDKLRTDPLFMDALI